MNARHLMAGVVGVVGVVALVGEGCKSSGEGGEAEGANVRDGGESGRGPSFAGDAAPDPVTVTRDPATCAEAQSTHSYVGCDYWPTVTANAVWSIFDFAAVVANVSQSPADITVTGPKGVNQKVTIAAGTVGKIYLPWVPNLKGEDWGGLPFIVPMRASVLEKRGAYHLISSVPVVVYQFNALEYKPAGGPAGKDWSKCPNDPRISECFSYSNDASLLLPSTAWTRNYRVTGVRGYTARYDGGSLDVTGGYIAIVASQDSTTVTANLSPNGGIMAGPAIPQTAGGRSLVQTLNAGDALELTTPPGEANDLSGSLIQADKPIQVISGIPCVNIPSDKGACDHVEESVMPAETLGKQYVVTTPTRPKGGRGIHQVRFYGNRDGTSLRYTPTKPVGCPDALKAGEVIDCGVVQEDFFVLGTHEFGVSSLMVGSAAYDPTGADRRGDPSQSTFGSTEQYRSKYLFLAPDDYDVSYAVVTGPANASPQIDGASLNGFTDIGGGFGVWRATLGAGQGGAHTLIARQAVGLQVLGYGANTSYQYPGGLNLHTIAPPPPPVR